MVSHSRSPRSEPAAESPFEQTQNVRAGAVVAMVTALAVGASFQYAGFPWLGHAALGVYLLALLTWIFAEEVAYHICDVPVPSRQ